MAGKKILLVDDEKSLRQLVGNALTHAGYSVELAASGDEGLTAALKSQPDLILSDIMMPIMDGYEMVKRLRQAGVGSYIIFLTARGGSADLVRGFDVEADDYLVKPFQMPELLARIRAGLRLREAQARLAEANDRLQRALAQRDDLISLIAHDLRNPIHVINSYAQIIGSDTLPAATVRDVCLRRSEEMLRLINNVTEMGNVEKHRMSFSLVRLNLGMLLREKLYVFEPLVEQKGVTLAKTIEETAPVFGDMRKLAEVVDSFLLAALQLAEPDSKVVINLFVKEDRAGLEVDVPAEMNEAAFERMFLLVEGGRGWNDGLDASAHLGLMVSSRIVRIMGGEFICQRIPGKQAGIRFGFSFLQADSDSFEFARQRIADAGGNVTE